MEDDEKHLNADTLADMARSKEANKEEYKTDLFRKITVAETLGFISKSQRETIYAVLFAE